MKVPMDDRWVARQKQREANRNRDRKDRREAHQAVKECREGNFEHFPWIERWLNGTSTSSFYVDFKVRKDELDAWREEYEKIKPPNFYTIVSLAQTVVEEVTGIKLVGDEADIFLDEGVKGLKGPDHCMMFEPLGVPRLVLDYGYHFGERNSFRLYPNGMDRELFLAIENDIVETFDVAGYNIFRYSEGDYVE